MDSVKVAEITGGEREAAREHPHGRSIRLIHQAEAPVFRQVLVTLCAGGQLADHDNPGNASLFVVEGTVRLQAGEDVWEGTAGDFLVIPNARHNLTAVDDAAVVVSFARSG